MEEKIKIGVRLEAALHLKAKRRMLDEFGEDNFQRLLHDFLTRYANPSAEGTAAPTTHSDSSPLDQLAPDEIALALGLIAGLRNKDVIISGLVETIKVRIQEKKYVLETKGTEARDEHRRRKIAG